MAKASSIAPKERINVTFKPATGGAQEEIELPLKVMVMGDFLQRHDPRRLLDRKPVQVSKNNFDDVMEKQNLELRFSVPDKLRENAAGDDLNVTLNVRSLHDFSPEGVARQVPELNALMELREALVSLKGPLGNLPAFRKAIEEVLEDSGQREAVLRELSSGARQKVPASSADSGNGADDNPSGKSDQ